MAKDAEVSNEAHDTERQGKRLRPWQRGLILLGLLVLLPIVLLVLAAYGIAALLLHLALWVVWVPSGRRVLFVYSNSPVWQAYIEENILPRLPRRSVVLNWSERRKWSRWTLGYWAFRFFGGRREFNPLAVVVRPLRWTSVFRFWKAFRDFKHGRRESLTRIENEFFKAVRRTPTHHAI
jgi:hypothetical protein